MIARTTGFFLDDVLHRETQFKSRAHPGHVIHFIAEDLLRELLAAPARRDRDDRVRMHVIDMLAWNETVQRRIDRARARIEIERGVKVHRNHVVLSLRLHAFVAALSVKLLKVEQFLLVERGKILALGGAQVAARSLDPQDFNFFAGQRVALHELRRGIAAAGIGDALVASQEVRSVHESINGIEFGCHSVVPKVINKFVVHGYVMSSS